jgi:hypothetical protein
MVDGPRATAPRLRYEGPITIGLAVVGAAITYVAFDEWFFGWMAGLLVGVFGGRALAQRRPDLANPRPAETPRAWQLVLVGILVVAVTAAVVIALSN